MLILFDIISKLSKMEVEGYHDQPVCPYLNIGLFFEATSSLLNGRSADDFTRSAYGTPISLSIQACYRLLDVLSFDSSHAQPT